MQVITAQIRRAIALVAILTLALAAMPLAGAAQDSSSDKELCKNGGWQTLTRADGTSFANQGECVSYIATGSEFGGSITEPEEPPVDPEPEPVVPIFHVTSTQLSATRCSFSVWLENPPAGQVFWLSAVGTIPSGTIYDWGGEPISPWQWEQIGANGLSIEVLESDGFHSSLAQVSISCGQSGSDDLYGYS